MAETARHLVVVPHTHWDREWYRTHEEFRYRLVRLLDGLLDLLDANPEFRHFTLDGQTVVVDDYLAVRPQARERLEKRVREGRVLVGPWFVLPDEWLVSGEALIRNLRLGLRQAAALGGAMPVGYVPDQFGHVGQLPQIFAGFGFEAAVLWRGVGGDVQRTLFQWEAPDGTRLFTVYLPFGYGNAVNLPGSAEDLAARLRFETGRLEKLSDVPTLLLMNGSDHVRPRPDLPRALETALADWPGTSFEIGTLPGFVRRAKAEAPPALAVHRGELRSGLRAHLLPGCASARMPQKQADFRNDRLLTRYLEPIAAWVQALGGDADRGVIDHAWRIALENHPHDSICGCSVDRVHDEMETRFRRVEEIARTHLAALASELAARVELPAPLPAGPPGEGLVVWNPNGAGRAGVDAELELDLPLRRGRVRAFHLRDAAGRLIPAAAELVEPEQVVASAVLPVAIVASLLPALDGEFAGLHAQEVRWSREGERLGIDVRLGSAPGVLDADALRRDLTAALAGPGLRDVAFRARRPPRLRLRFADELPGWGVRAYRVAAGPARGGPAPRSEVLAGGGAAIENEHWRVEADASGRITLVHRDDGLRSEDAIRLVSEGDRGDEYNFDPVPGAARVERPERARVRAEGAGEAEATLVVEGRWRVPAGLEADRARRARRAVALPARLRLRLARGLDRVDLEVALDNTARDHRLRLHVRAPFAARRFEVESAFEVAERPVAPRPEDFGSAHPAEFPIGTVPQRSFASVDDGERALVVASRGLAEVEAVSEADGRTSLALTLLRAVGWLSRDDLRLRPAGAGPSLPTPGAQVPGPHRAELSLRIERARDPGRVAEAHRFAHPPVAFRAGGGGAPRVRDGDCLVRISDPSVVLSAVEPREEGLLVRGWNASGEPRRVRIDLGAPGVCALEAVDLAERPDPSCRFEGAGAGGVLDLRPWQIFGLRARIPQG
jgi:alpha-mannosidase